MNAPPSGGATLLARLTPPGKAAIASLGLYGPLAWQAVRELFRPAAGSGATLPENPQSGRIWVGRLGQETTDDVVVSVKSERPVPWIEVHCHGGHEVVRLLQALFEAQGIQTCDWPRFLQVITGDPLKFLAIDALPNALTARTAGILLDQHSGALRRTLETILDDWRAGHDEQAGNRLRELANSVGVGRHLTSPWRVVIAGAPNVGKSSLVNALAGYQRCVVAATPGTTRDVVHTVIAIDGWPIELADTAGLREGAAAVEEQGIALARSAALEADLCLWVVDASRAPVWPDLPAKRMEIIVNKVDLPPVWDLTTAAGAPRLSASTGAGIGALCQDLSRWLVAEPPAIGAGVPFTTAVCEGVDIAWENYRLGRLTDSKAALERLLEPLAQ
jgi:tRNA modification GTPase